MKTCLVVDDSAIVRKIAQRILEELGFHIIEAEDGREENPVNLDPRMTKLAGGVHRLDGQLMVVLDVDRVLELAPDAKAA